MSVVVLLLGLVIVGLAIFAVVRGADVRLTLALAAITLGIIAGQPVIILQRFLVTLSDEKFVVPICSAMGFAYVVRHCGCDEHLVQLLCKPLRRIRILMIPGAVLVGFIVNIPIISQTSAAVSIGSVLIPLMYSAGLSPITAGAALILGCSIGGELLNPGAPEYGTVVKVMLQLSETSVKRADLVHHTLPLVLPHLFVACAVFWWISARAEAKRRIDLIEQLAAGTQAPGEEPVVEEGAAFKVNYIKAAIPFVPLAILFLTSRAFPLIHIPQEWLVDPKDVADLLPQASAAKGGDLFDSRLIGAAMLIGVAAAALTMLFSKRERGSARDIAKSFFEGAGYAFAEIIAIIVTASCFAEGVKLIGIGVLIGHLANAVPGLLVPMAGFMPTAFAFVSGSGMASTQGLYEFFANPATKQGVDPLHIGSIVALGAAAGRTISPAAAVVLMCAKMTDTPPLELVKRNALPLIFGVFAVVLIGAVKAVSG